MDSGFIVNLPPIQSPRPATIQPEINKQYEQCRQPAKREQKQDLVFHRAPSSDGKESTPRAI
jgi:hypothetical protein